MFAPALTSVVALAVGILLGTFNAESAYQQKALDHNCAQFDPKTGAFVWIEKPAQP